MHTTIDLQPLLRQEVGLFRARESRRVFDITVNVGSLAGPRDSFVVRAQDLLAVDTALRIDVVSSLLEQVDQADPSVWLSRPGDQVVHDQDLQWLAASTISFGIHGRDLVSLYAITRSGWLDVRTGERRVWKRLRL